MSNEELLELARELNGRGEPYALVTVVRAMAPTSAYLGAQAIVLADGTLHGWIGGGCAKGVVIGAAQGAIAKRRAEARANQQRADLSRRRGRATHDVLRQQRHDRALHPALQRAQRAVRARRNAGGRRGAVPRGTHRIRLTESPDEAPVVLVATQGQGDEDALEAALRSPARHVLMIASRRKAETLRERMRSAASTKRSWRACRRLRARMPAPRRRARSRWSRSSRCSRCCAGAKRAAMRSPCGTRRAPARARSSTRCAAWPSPSTWRRPRDLRGRLLLFLLRRLPDEFRSDPAKYAAIHRASMASAAP